MVAPRHRRSRSQVAQRQPDFPVLHMLRHGPQVACRIRHEVCFGGESRLLPLLKRITFTIAWAMQIPLTSRYGRGPHPSW